MVSSDPGLVLACDLAALLLSWLVGSLVLRMLERGGWAKAFRRSFGLALISFSFLLALRLVVPDLFAIPLLFLSTMAVDFFTSGGWRWDPRRPMISILIAIALVGSLLVVDHALRLAGYHLTLVI